MSWFTINLRDARWVTTDEYGASVRLEPEGERWPELGVNVRVLQPGQAGGRYHSEDAQEAFLVLSGEATLIVDDTEQPLRAWDFVHCPPGTPHIIVGAGDGPCAVLMLGARKPDQGFRYPVSETAARYGASVAEETTSAAEAYAGFKGFRDERPEDPSLPWI